jgi:hypothetical protein
MFNIPFMIFLKMYIDDQFNENMGYRWAMSKHDLLAVGLMIGSFDFIQPLITPYVRNHIRLQTACNFACGLLAAIFLGVTDLKFMKPATLFYFLGCAFNGLCNSMNTFEYFIREMTKDKTQQAKMIQHVAALQISAMLLCGVVCGFAWVLGKEIKHGFALLNLTVLGIGILGCVTLYFFFQRITPKKYHSEPLECKFHTIDAYWPKNITLILLCRFFVSMNYGTMRIVLIPILMEKCESIHKQFGFLVVFGMVTIGVLMTIAFLYIAYDPHHENKWVWFPHLHIIICTISPIFLVILMYVPHIAAMLSIGVFGIFFSTLIQAKLTIDRNIMSTDKVLPRGSDLSLILTGVGQVIACVIAPYLEQYFENNFGGKKIYALWMNVIILCLLQPTLIILTWMADSSSELEKYKDLQVEFEQPLLVTLYNSWREGHPMSEVGKTRLLCELVAVSRHDHTELSLESLLSKEDETLTL